MLFERSPRYLKLTAKGALLWEYAQQVADSYTLLDHGMKNIPSARELRIGATITIGNTLLSGIASALKKSQPDICQHLYVENTQALESRLLQGEIDIAFIEGVIRSDKIVKLPFAQDALELICAKGHPLYGQKQVRAEELRNQGLHPAGSKEAEPATYLRTICALRKFPFTLWESPPAAQQSLKW